MVHHMKICTNMSIDMCACCTCDHSYLMLVKSHISRSRGRDYRFYSDHSNLTLLEQTDSRDSTSETSQAFAIAPPHKFRRYWPRVQPFYFAQSASHLRRSALPGYNARSSPSHTSPFIRPTRFARVQPTCTT